MAEILLLVHCPLTDSNVSIKLCRECELFSHIDYPQDKIVCKYEED